MQHEGVIAFCIGKLRAGFEAVADPIGETAEELGGEGGGPGGVDASGAEGGLDCREGGGVLRGSRGQLVWIGDGAKVSDLAERRGRLLT